MDGIKWIGSPNHYNGRLGYKVTRITLHIMAGYLTGTDSPVSEPEPTGIKHVRYRPQRRNTPVRSRI